MRRVNLRRIKRRAQILFFAEWRTALISFFAIVIYAIGVDAFTIPYKFADQSIMGVAVLLNYTIGASPALVLLIANVFLLAWGARALSKRFLVWTIIDSFVLSAVLDILSRIEFPVIDDLFLAAVAGGVIKGLGVGLLYREGVSAGGLDIALMVLRKRYGIEVGKISFYFNMVILMVSLGIIGLEKVMYGFIAAYICGMAMDHVLASFDKRRLVFIVSSHADAVIEFISKKLGRGCTLLKSEGGWTRHEGYTVMCLLSQRQVVDLKRYIAAHFPGTFMAVTEANEVVGKGFKRWRNA